MTNNKYWKSKRSGNAMLYRDFYIGKSGYAKNKCYFCKYRTDDRDKSVIG